MQSGLGAAQGALWGGNSTGAISGVGTGTASPHPQMGCQEALQVRAKGTLADAWAGRKL